MKILYVVSGFAPAWGLGGVVRSSYELSKKMALKGHDVTVYATDIFDHKTRIDYKYKNWDGVKAYYFRTCSNFLAKRQINFSPQLAYELLNNIKNFDIVHIHEYRTVNSTLAAYFAKKNNVPYILQARGALPTYIGRKNFKRVYDLLFGYNILNNVSKVIALNKMEAEQYKFMGIDESKIEIVPNAINISKYENLPDKGSFKTKYNIKDDEEFILYLGRIHKIKGIDILVDAFSDLSKEFNNLKLVIVGPDDDGSLQNLKEMVENLNLGNKVLFTGPLYESEKLEAYIDSEVYVLPSIYEIFSNTVIEACFCGTPVVITDRCGIADFIDGRAGCVVGYDKDQLYQGIYEILTNEKLKEKFGLEGPRLIIEKFSLDNTANKVEDVYNKLLGR